MFYMNAKQKRMSPPEEIKKQSVGLTLQQVIALLDTRLVKLETAPKEGQSLQLVDEIEHRFTMLATEINDLKDIVMKLQSYTMDVNKTLLEERIQFMDGPTLDELKIDDAEILFTS